MEKHWVWRVDRSESRGFFFVSFCFYFSFSASRHNKPEQYPSVEHTHTPRVHINSFKKKRKKGLRDQWTGMSVYALIHAVHASVGKATRKVSPAVVHLLGHTHTQRVWRSHTKPEGLILPPAHVIQTHLFKAIVVLFVWFLWSRALCEHCCVFFFLLLCACMRVCEGCERVQKIQNKKWALRLWAIYCTYIPRNVLRCQYNHSKTAISRSEEWETYDSSCVCM